MENKNKESNSKSDMDEISKEISKLIKFLSSNEKLRKMKMKLFNKA